MNFQKRTDYLWNKPGKCTYVLNSSRCHEKMTEFWCFECRKRPFFTLFPATSAFSRFSRLYDLGHSKSVLWSFFSHSWRKTDLKTCITPPKPKIFSLTFPWTRDLKYAQCKLRMILRRVPDTIHVVVSTNFYMIRLWGATNPDTPFCQTFWLWPDLWHHRWHRGQQH